MRLLLKNWVLNCKTGIMKKIIYILFGMLAWWSCEDENSLIGPEGSISRYRYRQESIICCFALWRVCFGILNSSGWAWEKVSSPVRRSCWLSRGAY